MKDLSNIELKNIEIRDILKRPPPLLIRFGTLMIIGGAVCLIMIGFLISYPERITGEDVIFQVEYPPAFIQAHRAGEWSLIIPNNDTIILCGTPIAIYESKARLDDVLKLKKMLNECLKADTFGCISSEFVQNYQLGDLQTTYIYLLQSIVTYNNKINPQKADSIELSLRKLEMLMAIENWETDHLIYVPIDGVIHERSLLKKSILASTGDPLLTIIPEEMGSITASVILPVSQVNELESGQYFTLMVEDKTNQQYAIKVKLISKSIVVDKEQIELTCIVIDNKFISWLSDHPNWLKSDINSVEILYKPMTVWKRVFTYLINQMN